MTPLLNPGPRGRPPRKDDGGFTLLEITIGMTIMSIFLAIFGGAMINMFRSVDRTQQSAYAQSAVNKVYLRLDRQLRYADGISLPATDSAGNHNVEFIDVTSGQQVCTQMQLVTSTGVLRQRSWINPDSSTTTPTMRPTVVLSVDAKAGVPAVASDPDATVAGPFAMVAASGANGRQRLGVSISARDTGQVAGARNQVRALDLTFTALNTDTSTSSADVCSAGRSISW